MRALPQVHLMHNRLAGMYDIRAAIRSHQKVTNDVTMFTVLLPIIHGSKAK